MQSSGDGAAKLKSLHEVGQRNSSDRRMRQLSADKVQAAWNEVIDLIANTSCDEACDLVKICG